jgi:Mrp family chromosome partitioning ATPase
VALSGLHDAQEALVSDRAAESAVNTEIGAALLAERRIPAMAGRLGAERRERDAEEASYQNLALRRSAMLAEQAQGAAVGSVVTIDPARDAQLVTARRGRLVLLGSGLAILSVALSLAFLLEATDRRLSSEAALEALYGVRVLGPVLSAQRGTTMIQGSAAEFHRLRATLEAQLTMPAIIMVTSVAPDEGKTNLASGLASAFASSGVSTLLVDANDARPGVARRMGLSSVADLTDTDIATGAFSATDVNRLHVASLTDPSVAGTLSSQRVEAFCDRLRDRYAVTFFDCGTIEENSLALQLARISDGVVLAARFERLPDPQDERVRDRLEALGATTLGVVATRIPEAQLAGGRHVAMEDAEARPSAWAAFRAAWAPKPRVRKAQRRGPAKHNPLYKKSAQPGVATAAASRADAPRSTPQAQPAAPPQQQPQPQPHYQLQPQQPQTQQPQPHHQQPEPQPQQQRPPQPVPVPVAASVPVRRPAMVNGRAFVPPVPRPAPKYTVDFRPKSKPTIER